jgi:hypothetical protein
VKSMKHLKGSRVIKVWGTLASAVTRRSVTEKARVRARVSLGFVVNRVSLEQVSVRVLRFCPVSIIPPWLSIPLRHVGDVP